MPGPPSASHGSWNNDPDPGCKYLARGQQCYQGCKPGGPYVCHHFVKNGWCNPFKCRHPNWFHDPNTAKRRRRPHSERRRRSPPRWRAPDPNDRNSRPGWQGRAAGSGDVPPPPPQGGAPRSPRQPANDPVRDAYVCLGLNPTGENVTRPLMLKAHIIKIRACHPDKKPEDMKAFFTAEAQRANNAKDILDRLYPQM